jgi:acyl-CoA hydrolase
VANHIHSGFGGQPDFVTGALHSEGGHAVVALHAWHDKSDASTIVPVLTNPVTSFQHSAVVSEHGCAELFGRSEHAQAQLLIDQVADPRARPALAEAAGRLGLRRDFD